MTNMDHYTELRSRMARVRGRWKMLVSLRTAGRAMAAAAVPVLAAVAVVYLTGAADGALLLLTLAAMLAAAARGGVPALEDAAPSAGSPGRGVHRGGAPARFRPGARFTTRSSARWTRFGLRTSRAARCFSR